MGWSDPAELRTQDLYAEMKRLARNAPVEVAIVIAGMTAMGIATDFSSNTGGMAFGLSILNLAAGYWLTIRLMEKGGLLPGGKDRGFGSYFGLGLLSGLGIMIGLLLLVIPGVILLVRWLPAYGFMYGERLSATQALERSWQATRPHFPALLVAALLPIAFYVISIAVYEFPQYLPDMPFLARSVAGNLAAFLNLVLWSLLGLASYSLLGADQGEAAEVFA